jgi:hypothetical protein
MGAQVSLAKPALTAHIPPKWHITRMANEDPKNPAESQKSAFAPLEPAKSSPVSNGHTVTNGGGITNPNGTVAITRHRTATGRWQAKFIQVFKQTGIVRAAAEAAGIDRQRVYEYRDKHPKFAAEWAKAIDESTELLELHAIKRATLGEDEPIWMNSKQGPQLVGTKKVKSDRLLEFILRARKPHLYRENQTVEVTGPGGSAIAPIIQAQQVSFVIPSNNRHDPAHQLTEVQSTTPDTPKA